MVINLIISIVASIIFEAQTTQEMEEVVEITELIYSRLSPLYQIATFVWLINGIVRTIEPATSNIIPNRAKYMLDTV